MRILFDSRMIYMSGIGRYIRCLLRELAVIDEELEFDLMGCSEDFNRLRNINLQLERANCGEHQNARPKGSGYISCSTF